MRPRNVACWHSTRSALRPLLAVFVAALIAGCAISFVAPYDEAIDKQLTELHLRTRVFLAKMSATRGAYGNNIAFYREAHASVAVLLSRAKLYGDKNKGTVDNLNRLDAAFTDLEEAHRAGPLVGPAYANTIDVHFESLLQIELHKKFSSGVAAPKT
jgi:hypothetical protein